MTRLTRRAFLAAGASALAMAAGCSGPGLAFAETPTGRWRQRAHDARNTGSADVAVPARVDPAWDAGEAHIAAPLVADGTVYSASHEVTALDARTGDLTWEADLDGKVDHAPALVDGVLVVAADDQVVGLDPADGDEVWSVSLAGVATAPVTAGAGPAVATVPVEDERLVALDPATGDRRWDDPTRVFRPTAIADGTVYAVAFGPDGDGGLLRAFDAADGRRRWTVELDRPGTPPVVADEGLLVDDRGVLGLHDPATGERERDLVDLGEGPDLPPAVDDGTAYVAGDGWLAAVSLDDGAEAWREDVQVTVDTGVTVGRDAVVAPVTDLPGIAAFERADGSTRWEHRIEGFDAAASTPAVLADGAAFYSSNESLGVVGLGDVAPADA